MASKANGSLGSSVKALRLLAMAVLMVVAGVAFAGRLAIKTSNETGERRRIVYVVEDASGRTVREVREVVSPGNAARVTLRGLRRGTYNVTPYAWMQGGAWRSSVPLAESRAVSVDRGGVEVVEFAIAGNGGGGGGGNGEVTGWPNGIVFFDNTGFPFANAYTMKHPVHTGGVVKNYVFDATVASTQAGFNDKIPFGAGSALHSWSGTINVVTAGGNSGVGFVEGVGTQLDPTTYVIDFAVVNGVVVARAMPQASAKRPVRFAELAPGVFVGSTKVD